MLKTYTVTAVSKADASDTATFEIEGYSVEHAALMGGIHVGMNIAEDPFVRAGLRDADSIIDGYQWKYNIVVELKG